MSSTGLTRRSLLASASAGVAAATAGCFSRLRSRITYDPSTQVTLSVKTVPADRDPSAVMIGRRLRDNLDAVGVDATHELVDEIQLLRDAFLNHDYDIFVTELPGHDDPDELRSLLHSRFGPEVGLQNPYGHAAPATDELLEAQRAPGSAERTEVVDELQRQILTQQPFLTVLSRPYTTAVSTDLVVQGPVDFASSLSYLTVENPVGSLDTLTVGIQRPNATENRNPLAIEYRLHDRLTDLVYDPLVRSIGGQYVPWLASEFAITDEDHTATVSLRPNLTWHDGESLTAADVAFTYRFLRDTALGETDSPVPAPRFRRQSSLVRDATVVDRTTVELDLVPTRPRLAPSALTVPILPEHRWRPRATPKHEYFTKAIVGTIGSPIGSGPFQFEGAEEEISVTFSRFDEHFLRTTSELPNSLAAFAGGPSYGTLSATDAPNIGVVLEDIAGGSVDVLDGTIPVDGVPDARSRNGVRIVEAPTSSYYVIGINARRHPLSNFAFRSALGRLIDRDAIVEGVFDGDAMATETPLHDTNYVSEDLRWDGESVTGAFPGEDGDIDRDAARQLFEDAGFQYHDGTLRSR